MTTAHPPIAATGQTPAHSAYAEPCVDHLEPYLLDSRIELPDNLRVPGSMLRLQRRDAFRAPTPVANSPDVLLPPTPDDSGETKAARLRITDISATGLAFVALAGRPILSAGMRLPGCLIRLVAGESFRVDIEIRRVGVFKDGFGRDSCHAGCHLLGLTGAAEMALERYVHRLDVARRHNP